MFVDLDRRILVQRDAAEECLTPEVQKFTYGVVFQSLKFQKLAKLKKVKELG